LATDPNNGISTLKGKRIFKASRIIAPAENVKIPVEKLHKKPLNSSNMELYLNWFNRMPQQANN